MKNVVSHITNKINRPRIKISKVKGVVVHWTANEGKKAHAVANRNYFQNTTRAASCHLIVDDTQLVEALPWKKKVAEMAYHVGSKTYKSGIASKLSSYPNNSTIGLEICVNVDGDFKKTYANAVNVTAMMLKEHGLGTAQLYRHWDITGKNCPAFFVDNGYAKKYLGTTGATAWGQFVSAVARVLEGGKASSPEQITVPSTSKVIGTVKIKVDKLALRKDASFSSALIRELNINDTYKVYQLKNGLYNLGSGWVSAGKAYVTFTPAIIVAAPVEETLFRVFRNAEQEGAFSIQTNAIEFARELHEEDPFDLVTVVDSNENTVLKLQDFQKVVEVFRVRKSANDAQTQKGAFSILENAKAIADQHPGYRVYDGSGKLVYVPAEKEPEKEVVTPPPPPTPETIEADWHAIMGPSEASVEQMIYYVNQHCLDAPKDVAKHFYEVGLLEGVRGDVALAQAIKETGSFVYGGDVKPEQNNFCGLGATGNGAPGLSFATVREGVTAQIQHLKAYASIEALKLDNMDPRFKYVTPRGKAPHVEQLAGKWAVPGFETKKYISLAKAMENKDAYGHQIMRIVDKIKAVNIPNLPVQPTPSPNEELNISLLNKVLQLIFDFLTKIVK